MPNAANKLSDADIDALTKRTQDGGTEVVQAKAGKVSCFADEGLGALSGLLGCWVLPSLPSGRHRGGAGQAVRARRLWSGSLGWPRFRGLTKLTAVCTPHILHAHLS